LLYVYYYMYFVLHKLHIIINIKTYPVPTIGDVRYKIRNSNFFTKLDIRKTFHQIELSSELRELPLSLLIWEYSFTKDYSLE